MGVPRSARFHSLIALLTLAMAALPAVARAQTTPPKTSSVRGASGWASQARSNAQTTERPEIRITPVAGVRRVGRLVSLSDADVVIQERRPGCTDPDACWNEARIPLSSVRRIERVDHTMRNYLLAGLIGGGIVGIAQGLSYHDEGRIVAPIFDTAIGVGAGAVVGLILRSRRSDDRILYPVPQRTARIIPAVSSKGAGIRVAIQW